MMGCGGGCCGDEGRDERHACLHGRELYGFWRAREKTEATDSHRDTEARRRTEFLEPRRSRRVWPFDWPPKAACREARGRRYKPHRCHRRLVSAASYIAAVGAPRAPTNRTAPPCVSVPPWLRLKPFSPGPPVT